LFALYRKVYFAFGTRKSDAASMGDVLPELRRISAKVWRG
jgi:L-ribulokinase